MIKEENFKWHLEAFASELFNYNNKNGNNSISSGSISEEY